MLLEGYGALGVGGEARVVYGNDVGGGYKGRSDGGGVMGCFAGAEVQGFEAAVSEPAVEGGRDGANCVLEEREALVEGGGIEGRDAHEHVGVTVDVFGD